MSGSPRLALLRASPRCRSVCRPADRAGAAPSSSPPAPRSGRGPARRGASMSPRRAPPATSLSEASNPTKRIFPARPGSAGARSIPKVVDSLGAKTPCTPPGAAPSAPPGGSRWSRRALGGGAAVLGRAHDRQVGVRLDGVEEPLLAVGRARRALLVAEHRRRCPCPRARRAPRPPPCPAASLSVATKLTWSPPADPSRTRRRGRAAAAACFTVPTQRPCRSAAPGRCR